MLRGFAFFPQQKTLVAASVAAVFGVRSMTCTDKPYAKTKTALTRVRSMQLKGIYVNFLIICLARLSLISLCLGIGCAVFDFGF